MIYVIFGTIAAMLTIGISICFSETAELRGKMVDLQFPAQSDRIYVITISRYSSLTEANMGKIAAQINGRVVWLMYDPEKEPRPEVQVIE